MSLGKLDSMEACQEQSPTPPPKKREQSTKAGKDVEEVGPCAGLMGM